MPRTILKSRLILTCFNEILLVFRSDLRAIMLLFTKFKASCIFDRGPEKTWMLDMCSILAAIRPGSSVTVQLRVRSDDWHFWEHVISSPATGRRPPDSSAENWSNYATHFTKHELINIHAAIDRFMQCKGNYISAEHFDCSCDLTAVDLCSTQL